MPVNLFDAKGPQYGGKIANLAAMPSQYRAIIPNGIAFLPDEAADLSTDKGLWDSRWDLAGAEVIVRSSALDEDGCDHSLAGQLDSIRCSNTSASILSAMKKCLSASEGARVASYRRHQAGQPTERQPTALLVQEFVDAKISGVYFSHAPLAPDTALIEVVEGGCQSLVDGSARPSRCHILRDGSVRWDGRPVLTKAQVRLVEELGEACFGQLGRPCDVEWLIDHHSRVRLLQNRAITAMETTTNWSNRNMQENYPTPVCPLLYSIAQMGYRGYFSSLGQRWGLGSRAMGRLRASLQHCIGSQDGHLYYNLTSIYQLFEAVPFERLTNRWNAFLTVQGSPPQPARQMMRKLWMVLNGLVAFSRLKRGVRRFESRVEAFQPGGEWVSWRQAWHEFREIREFGWADAALSDAATMFSTAWLRERLGNCESSMAALLESGKPLPSQKPVDDLARLIEQARRLPVGVQKQVADGTMEWREFLNLPGIKKPASAYIADWGFRVPGELLLTKGGLDERPEILFGWIRAGLSQASQSRRDQTPRPRASVVTRLLAHLARWSIAARESCRLAQGKLYHKLRKTSLQLGAYLSDRGVLEDPGDIFFLEFEEVSGILNKSYFMLETLPAIVEARKACHRRHLRKPHPHDTVAASHEEWLAGKSKVIKETTAQKSDTEKGLRGTPSSPGRVEGVVQVVSSLEEIDRVRKGVILVTRNTDPGWTPVFSNISGLVLERGGQLCHGAIVAREFALPAVTDIDDATSLLRDGDLVSIDGNTGEVRFVEAPT